MDEATNLTAPHLAPLGYPAIADEFDCESLTQTDQPVCTRKHNSCVIAYTLRAHKKQRSNKSKSQYSGNDAHMDNQDSCMLLIIAYQRKLIHGVLGRR